MSAPRRRPALIRWTVAAAVSAWFTLVSVPAGAQDDGLGALAATIGIDLGVAADADVLGADDAYDDLLVTDSTMLSTIDDVAIGVVQPEPGVFDFARTDAIVDFAAANDLRVRGHGLVGPDNLPGWLTAGQWTSEALTEVLREHVTTVVGRYAERNPGVVTQWDVVSEAFLPDGSRRPTIWQQVIGDDHLAIAFDAARAADPDAQLFYNDFYDDLSIVDDAVESGVDLVPGATAERTTCDAVPKCVGARAALAGLVDAGVPIDGVGFQAHLFSPDPYDFGAFTDWVEPLGLRWAVTEFDVPLPVTEIANPDVLAFQADAYRTALTACIDDPACDTFVMWGITDRVSPIPAETEGVFGGALPRDATDAPKPAHDALRELLTDRADAVAPATTAPPTTQDPTATAPPTSDEPPVNGDDDGDGPLVPIVAAAALGAVALLVVRLRRRSTP